MEDKRISLDIRYDEFTKNKLHRFSLDTSEQVAASNCNCNCNCSSGNCNCNCNCS